MLQSQKSRKENPEIDPLLLGSGWTPEDLSKPQVLLESAYGDSHPGNGHLNQLKKMAFLKGSGMPEMFKTTEILFARPELRTSVALVTDGRFSGATDKGASMLRGRG